MSKITKIDRNSMQALRDPIEAEIKALAERLGLTLRLGNGSFSPNGDEGSFKLEIKVDDPATKLAAAKAGWDRNCTFIGIDFADPDNTGLRPADFGTEFVYAGTTFRTTGIATKGKGSQKFPIKAEVVKSGNPKHGVGATLMLPETAVKIIRAATDAAKPAPKAKAKAA